MDRYYYGKLVSEFLEDDNNYILGCLAKGQDLIASQRQAWLFQIDLLKRELASIEGWIGFEFTIPRIGKRADVIVIYQEAVFVIEFKIGAKTYTKSAIDQVIDYALDLKNFHSESDTVFLVPILIVSELVGKARTSEKSFDNISGILITNGKKLVDTFKEALDNQNLAHSIVNYNNWLKGSYRPTPTIIEAARSLYAGNTVENISRNEAGIENLTVTSNSIESIIHKSRLESRKSICFITGVPGSGKTLVGLNLATKSIESTKDEHAVLLSGNGPLVAILREALVRDRVASSTESKARAQQKINSFIQNIHHFRDEYLKDTNSPSEHVVVFDEAQRAWDEKSMSNFLKQKRGLTDIDMSEPSFLLSVMNRHKDWCAVICLVGNGQEINKGEAGIQEWLTALETSYSDWDVYAGPEISNFVYSWDQESNPTFNSIKFLNELHLKVSVRSFRAEQLSNLVNLLIDNELTKGKALYALFKELYPIYLTRELSTAKAWLKEKARGTERIGLVASSGAIRLKADGISVKEKISPSEWFLNSSSDVRSSYYLEGAATEFEIQGLELDWICVCWEADFRFQDSQWQCYQFRGSSWQSVKSESKQQYIMNAYRVLLTRARQGMIIYVPMGSSEDPTRPPKYFNGIYKALALLDFEVI